MTTSEDVKTLFRRFGGQPETYQEVVREDHAEHSMGKWPMLGQVDLEHVLNIPAARRTVQTSATRPYSESLAVAASEQMAAIQFAANRARQATAHPTPAPAARPPHTELPPAPTAPPVLRQVVAAAPDAAADMPVHKPAAQPRQPLFQAAQAAPAMAVQAPMPAPSPAAATAPLPQPESPSFVPAYIPDDDVDAPIPPVAKARKAPGSSPLASRFRAQAAPEPAPEPFQPPAALAPQSLTSLFGRLAQPQVKAESVGVLKRKFVK